MVILIHRGSTLFARHGYHINIENYRTNIVNLLKTINPLNEDIPAAVIVFAV